jgi:ACS family hexuronate transporter-like MFS transporter
MTLTRNDNAGVPVAAASPATATEQPAGSVGSFRRVICGLLLFGATINYMDRTILGVFKTTLQHDLGWSDQDYSNLVAYFQGAYAISMLAMGRLIDRLGTRRGYSVAMVLWSLASMAMATRRSLRSLRSSP